MKPENFIFYIWVFIFFFKKSFLVNRFINSLVHLYILSSEINKLRVKRFNLHFLTGICSRQESFMDWKATNFRSAVAIDEKGLNYFVSSIKYYRSFMPSVHFKEGTWVYWKHFLQRRWFPWGGDVIIGLGNAPLLNLTISEDRFLSCVLIYFLLRKPLG